MTNTPSRAASKSRTRRNRQIRGDSGQAPPKPRRAAVSSTIQLATPPCGDAPGVGGRWRAVAGTARHRRFAGPPRPITFSPPLETNTRCSATVTCASAFSSATSKAVPSAVTVPPAASTTKGRAGSGATSNQASPSKRGQTPLRGAIADRDRRSRIEFHMRAILQRHELRFACARIIIGPQEGGKPAERDEQRAETTAPRGPPLRASQDRRARGEAVPSRARSPQAPQHARTFAKYRRKPPRGRGRLPAIFRRRLVPHEKARPLYTPTTRSPRRERCQERNHQSLRSLQRQSDIVEPSCPPFIAGKRARESADIRYDAPERKKERRSAKKISSGEFQSSAARQS